MTASKDYRTRHGADGPHDCIKKICPKFDVKKYLQQLQQFLPCVPSISTKALRSLHKARDYKGMVQLIKKTMNIGGITFRIIWVPEGGATKGKTKEAPAWVKLLGEMPFFGTDEFKNMSLDFFFRNSFLEKSAYDQVAICIAHELHMWC